MTKIASRGGGSCLKLFDVCLCNVLVLCYYFFFQLQYHYFSRQNVLTQWAQPSLQYPRSYHHFIFIPIRCLLVFKCMSRVRFSCFFFFSTFIWFFFGAQTCVDSVGATIFTFPEVIQLNVFIAVPNHFVFWKSKIFFLQVSTWRRQCGYLPHTSWKWPENKTNRVRRHLGDKMFSTVAKSVSGSQCLCSTKFVFLSQEHTSTDIHNTHKHDFLHKK